MVNNTGFIAQNYFKMNNGWFFCQAGQLSLPLNNIQIGNITRNYFILNIYWSSIS